MGDEMTTVQIDVKTRDMLKRLATEDFRSMTAELRWLTIEEDKRRRNKIERANRGEDSEQCTEQ